MDTKKTAEALAKAIGYTENGGKPNLDAPKAGKTGELASIYQFTPDTWKNYSTQIFGKVVPMNPDSETAVVLNKAKNALDKGYTPEQFLSMWNAGEGEPDAYSGKFSNGQPSHGVNAKYGVKFDVPGYVKKGMSYFDQFSGGDMAQNQQTAPTHQPQQGTTNNSAPLQKLMAIISQARQGQAPQPQTPQSAPGLLGKTAQPV